jgi:predicted permease
LPVRQPDALMLLDAGSWTNPIWEQIRARQYELFDGAFAWSGGRFNLSSGGPADMVPGTYASGGMFDVLGVHAAVGRLLTPEDDRPGGGRDGPVAVISDRLWRQRFNRSPDAVGGHISINGVPFLIIGVMPLGFFGPDVGIMLDLVVPLADEALIRGAESNLPGRTTWWLDVMARRKPGQSIEQANAALRAAQPRIREATLPPSYQPSLADYLREPLTLVPAEHGSSQLRGRYQQPLTIIMVVVAVVLLIACANIANLLLARSVARRHEIVLRMALGASRLRLVRQLLIESAVLAGAGAALGLGAARVGGQFLVRQISTPGNSVFLDIPLDTRVLAFTAGVTALTALIFGLAPSIGATGVAPNDVLKAHARGVTGDRRWSLRSALVVVQVALSLALVVGAGLFVRTFASLVTLPLGMNPSAIVSVNISVQRSHTAAKDRAPLFERFRQAAAALPGVTNAALSQIVPLSGQGWSTVIGPASSANGLDRQRMSWVNAVSPGFFGAYGIAIVAGRDFTRDDRDDGLTVAIVNEAFARRFFAGRNPVGMDFQGRIGKAAGQNATYQIVGLVSDAAYKRLRDGAVPTVYLPLTQTSQTTSINLAVQTTPAARGALSVPIARAVGAVDGAATLTIRPFDDYLTAGVAQERLVALLSASFGALALLLAALGLYGVTSYGVSRRRAEIGVRMALGADPAGMVRLVLGRVGWLVGSGVLAGMALSWWASRFISGTLLYGVTSRDAPTFVAAAGVLLVVSAAAAWLPARRAARIDPVHVLRET